VRGNEEHSSVTGSIDNERHSDLTILQNLLLLAIISLVAVAAGILPSRMDPISV
jgi:hypothetical protein